MPRFALPTFPAARILVVDDEPGNVRLLEILLRRAGYTDVAGTTDARDVPRLLAGQGADIVLLDLLMPDVSGYDLLAQIPRIVGPDAFLPILVLTADVTREARTQALELGATDFVVKPFDHDEVLLRVANLLETRRLHLRLDDRVRAMADGAPVILFATDDTGDVTLATGAGLAAAGLTPGDVLGRSILEIALDAPDLRQVLAGALAGRDGSTTARIGHEWCVVRGGPLREGSDQVSGMLCVATIVTERKTAEDALRSATRRLEAIVAAAPLPMLSIRADGTVDSWNPAAERVFGWKARDVLDRPVPIATDGAWPGGALAARPAGGGSGASAPRGDRPKVARPAEPVVPGAEIAGLRRDGSLLDLRVWMAGLEGLDAGAEMAIVEDVTEAKRIARERSRLGAAVEQMVESMIFVDRAGLIRHVNPAFERASGWAAAEVVGRHVTAFYEYSPSRPVNHTALLSHDRAEPWEGDIVGRRRDGGRYTIHANITPFHAEGDVGPGVRGRRAGRHART